MRTFFTHLQYVCDIRLINNWCLQLSPSSAWMCNRLFSKSTIVYNFTHFGYVCWLFFDRWQHSSTMFRKTLTHLCMFGHVLWGVINTPTYTTEGWYIHTTKCTLSYILSTNLSKGKYILKIKFSHLIYVKLKQNRNNDVVLYNCM